MFLSLEIRTVRLSTLPLLCVLAGSLTQAQADILNAMPDDPSCVDFDGDGWGWNGSGNCPPFIGAVEGQTARLTSTEGDVAEFGQWVSIDGDTMVVTTSASNFERLPARVTIIKRNAADQWVEEAILFSDEDYDARDSFGSNIILDGSTLAISAQSGNRQDGYSRGSGVVYIFERTGNSGTWSQTAKLIPSDAEPAMRFGRRLALAGNTILISTDEDEDPPGPPGIQLNPNDSGSVYVFSRQADGNWIEETKIQRIAPGIKTFGDNISLSASNLAIISGGSSPEGAYLFKQTSFGVWNETGRYQPPSELPSNGFYFTHDNQTFVVNHSVETAENILQLNLYTYQLGANGERSGRTEIALPANLAGYYISRPVLDGDTLALPVIFDAGNGSFFSDKAILIYKQQDDTTWVLHNTLRPSLSDPAGFSRVRLHDDTAVVGAPSLTSGIFKQGSVYVFDVSVMSDGDRIQNNCVDTDGDGWGWNGTASCSVSSDPGVVDDGVVDDGVVDDGVVDDTCDYTAAALNNGWGWDPVNNASCPPDTNSGCDYSDADLYNGWGWNPDTRSSCPPL